jgi:hypothetical protein
MPNEPISGELDELLVSIEESKKMEEAKANVPPPKKCDIRLVLPANVIELLQSAPHNDTVRTLVEQKLKLQTPIPKELLTFEAIKDWVENTVSSDVVKVVSHPLVAAISKSATQYGKCSYSVSVSGSGAVHIPDKALIEMVEEADGDGDVFVELVRDYISEHEEVEMDSDGNYDTTDYQPEGEENSEVWQWDNWRGFERELHNKIKQLCPEAYSQMWE